ncbi:MAG: D-alanyl-D-alanine carboxypeptidase [Oscillospiraceae bacterium]|nr:D-alanyl-D-alanine carboxypeptidase [Oscillospiraceae bacterium]
MKKKLSAFLTVLLLLSAFALPTQAWADIQPYAQTLIVDGSPRDVRALDGSYEKNVFLSLTDAAAALSGTDKQFRFERVMSTADGEVFTVIRGQSAVMASGAEGLPKQSPVVSMNLSRNRLQVDGNERKYYSFNPQNGDLYLSVTDLQLMLDLNLVREADGSFSLNTGESFHADPYALLSAGFFDGVGSIYLADADTGEVLFQRNSQTAVPCASLSKLLSYVILKEAARERGINENGMVPISENAQKISRSGDGMVTLNAGTEVPFQELLEAMLIASSNESALALAEYTCGDEASFVARMNQRAQELGLSTATMWNCNGLPSYTDAAIPVKRQNLMSAEDLFRLCRYILKNYPEITWITSKQLAHMPSLNDYWTVNSNPLVYNLEGVDGLKTGHTNRAGYCVAASMPVSRGDGTHTIVLILMGAETAELRGQAAEILLRYAKAQAA